MIRRRAKGDGCIREVSPGKWRGYVTIPDSGSKRRWVSGKSKDEVRRKLRELNNDIEAGRPLPPARLTVGTYLDTWLEQDVRPNRRRNTYRGYEVNVRVHIKPALGHKRLQALTYDDVQAWINTMRDTGKSPRTIQYARAVLRAALFHAMLKGNVARNVAQLVKVPTQQKPDLNCWSPDQARVFMQGVRGHKFEALFLVAVTLGPRAGELLGLRWDALDLERGQLHIRETLECIRGNLTFSIPKTAGSKRTLILPKFLVTALRAHRSRQLEQKLKMGAHWEGDKYGLVFPTERGTPMDESNYNRAFMAVVASLPLPRIRVHDLRHTAATTMLIEGVDVNTVSKMLGHTSVRFTLDTYGHVLEGQRQRAADSLDRLFGEG